MAEAAGQGRFMGKWIPGTLSSGVEAPVLTRCRRVGVAGSDGGDAGATNVLRTHARQDRLAKFVVEALTARAVAARPQHALPRQEQSVLDAAGSHVHPRPSKRRLRPKLLRHPPVSGVAKAQLAIFSISPQPRHPVLAHRHRVSVPGRHHHDRAPAKLLCRQQRRRAPVLLIIVAQAARMSPAPGPHLPSAVTTALWQSPHATMPILACPKHFGSPA